MAITYPTTRYTTSLKVAQLLITAAGGAPGPVKDFGAATIPSQEEVQSLIRRAEDEIDLRTHNAWRTRWVENEFHSLNLRRHGMHRRQHGFPHHLGGLRVFLDHKNIRAFVSGTHKVEIWQGNAYKDLVANGTEGRNSDFYVDRELGIVYLMNERPHISENGTRFTYEYGGADTLVNDAGDIDNNQTSITVDSTAGFEPQGVITLESEDMFYATKTGTTFANITRGINETTAATHDDDTPIIQVPEDIVKAATLIAAINLLDSSDLSAVLPEHAPEFTLLEKREAWRKDSDRILANRREITRGRF